MKKKEEELKHELGKIIWEYRRLHKNFSRERVGEEANIDSNNLGRIERGKQLPEITTLLKLTFVLDIDYLLHRETLEQLLDLNKNTDY